MNRSSIVLILAVGLGLSRCVLADAAASTEKKPAAPTTSSNKATIASAQPAAEATPSPSGKVQVLVLGEGIKISSDGSIKAGSISTDVNPAKRPPAEVQKLIGELSQHGSKVVIITSPKASVATAVEASPEKAAAPAKGQMRIVVVGPDGKKTETVVDLSDVKPLSPGAGINLKPLLEASGVKLPEEARKALEQVDLARKKAAEARAALEAKRAELTKGTEPTALDAKIKELQKAAEQLRAAGVQVQKREIHVVKPMADVHAKLDQILQRLDRLEKEVQSLKKPEQK